METMARIYEDYNFWILRELIKKFIAFRDKEESDLQVHKLDTDTQTHAKEVSS